MKKTPFCVREYLLAAIVVGVPVSAAHAEVFNRVVLDQRGNLVFDGKPVFASGWWAAQEAHAGQFYCYVTGCRIINRSGNNPFFYFSDFGDVTGRPDPRKMKEFARNVDDEPLMNLRSAEARRRGAIELNAEARAYKKAHPGCLALTVLAPAEPSPRNWPEFIRAVDEIDIWVVDPYVGASKDVRKHKPVAWVQDYVRQMMTAVARSTRPKRPVWCLLQGFDSSDASGTHPKRQFIYPTPAENRATAFLSVVEGAGGVQWFRFQNGRGEDFIQDSAPDLAESIWQVCLEMQRLEPALTLPPTKLRLATPLVPEPHPGWHKPYDVGVHFIEKYVAAEMTSYIIAVNSGSLTRFDQVRIPIKHRFVDPVVHVISEGREAKIVDGRIVDGFAPMAVHIYRVGQFKRDNAVMRFDFEADRQPAEEDGRGKLFDGVRYKMTHDLLWKKVHEESYGGKASDWLRPVSSRAPSYTRDVPRQLPDNKKALRFRGREALQLPGRTPDLGPWTTFTIGAWFKVENEGAWSQDGTIVRLSSWSESLEYNGGSKPNVAGILVSDKGTLYAECRNTMGGSCSTQRLELPNKIADGRFHHAALIRRRAIGDRSSEIGLVLDGRHAVWVVDNSGGAPIAFNQGARNGWHVRNDVGGQWNGAAVVNGFQGVIDALEITNTKNGQATGD